MDIMTLMEQVVSNEKFEREIGRMPSEHRDAILKALELLEQGVESYREDDPDEYIDLLERALRHLKPVKGVLVNELDVLRALIHTMLIGAYAKGKQYDAALASGQAALNVLSSDPKLADPYAYCLHNLGLAFADSGQIREGIKLLEQAMLIYDNLRDHRQRRFCLNNLERLRTAIGEPSKRPSIWSRLFERR